MRDQILRFMREYPEARERAFANNPYGAFVRTEIPEALYATGLVDREKYLITASVGAGNWAMIPWICIFDRSITTSATKGVYIVYLLSKDSKRLYLTFNQGCTEISNSHSKRETIQIMRNKAAEIVSYTNAHGFGMGDDIDLGEGLTSLGQYYERGTIYYKRYDVDAIPSEEELRQDLSDMMAIYRQYTDHQDDGGWWPPLSEYDPGISKEKWFELLNDPECLGPVWGNVLAMFYDYGGAATCSQLALQYGGTAMSISGKCTAFAKNIHKKTQCPIALRESGENRYWTIPFLGKNAEKGEAGTFKWKLRPELHEALKDFDILRFLRKPGPYDSWEIIDENTAVKHCDKSFFDHNGSGVPKEICWFFGAEKLEVGQNVPLTLIYDGQQYSGRISNETTDRRRVRVFWGRDLGSLLGEYKGFDFPMATFKRIGEYKYEIKMKGDEAEVSVKEQVELIKAYIAARGFSYDPGLIENFYLSLKSKPFVILAGTSGTGKTRLVRLFAEAIGAAYEQVPVRPDWSDSTDLFGHVDLNGNYVAGKILDFLWDARENQNRPYILCLDEMNLARVEYYMSDFLSVIETRDWSDGRIVTDPLVSAKDYGIDSDAADHFGVIRFPENLYIVGTVNMDETTFQFSRKVLDRANTIEFNYVNLVPTWSDAVENVVALELENDFLRGRYLRLTDCLDADREYASGVCAELEKMNAVLARANAHVGYRIRDEIVFYLLNNREAGLLDENAAMDNEILQKILPRIHGSSASVKSMLCDLFKEVAGDYEGYQTESNNTADRMLDMLRKNEHVRYPRSAEKIAFMVRRFEEDGFTSYWL